jgi:hypothetical protein
VQFIPLFCSFKLAWRFSVADVQLIPLYCSFKISLIVLCRGYASHFSILHSFRSAWSLLPKMCSSPLYSTFISDRSAINPFIPSHFRLAWQLSAAVMQFIPQFCAHFGLASRLVPRMCKSFLHSVSFHFKFAWQFSSKVSQFIPLFHTHFRLALHLVPQMWNFYSAPQYTVSCIYFEAVSGRWNRLLCRWISWCLSFLQSFKTALYDRWSLRNVCFFLLMDIWIWHMNTDLAYGYGFGIWIWIWQMDMDMDWTCVKANALTPERVCWF